MAKYSERPKFLTNLMRSVMQKTGNYGKAAKIAAVLPMVQIQNGKIVIQNDYLGIDSSSDSPLKRRGKK